MFQYFSSTPSLCPYFIQTSSKNTFCYSCVPLFDVVANLLLNKLVLNTEKGILIVRQTFRQCENNLGTCEKWLTFYSPQFPRYRCRLICEIPHFLRIQGNYTMEELENVKGFNIFA